MKFIVIAKKRPKYTYFFFQIITISVLHYIIVESRFLIHIQYTKYDKLAGEKFALSANFYLSLFTFFLSCQKIIKMFINLKSRI